ncbi:MAG: hypothetical protein LGB07_05660 [Sulfurovum sp.]|nr:hypothetical protein [Sulfurovum sp.]MCB4745118.1 hypothetical protein [Sulfurovum sp.]MCB4746157.1 hypothetical protein [Sulfurovum sp.]MCB4749089.1 hypothetical protein [Sulfurovum sp.]MCB4750460.1 hypothetical protein [Sulfurovum sp.]
MKIEDIVNLTEGQLVNSPKVGTIEAATVYASKIDQGDLFFSSSQEEIDKALENGAYAIVYDNDKILKKDEEIAWIKVSSVQLAAFKLIRYVVLKKEAKFYYLLEHEMSFLKMILTHKGGIAFITNDWRKAFEKILNSDNTLFVGTDKTLLHMIKPDIPYLNREVEGYPISDTLFRTTFKVNGFIYQEKKMIPFHLEYLLRVVRFCNTHELPYSIDRIRYTKHFIPTHIDGNLNHTKSSRSDKVAIFVDNLPDIEKAREYVKCSNMWVKSIVLTPPKTKVPGIDHPHWFEDEEEVRELLKSMHFNYAFIYNTDKRILNTIKEAYSLF